MPVAPAALSARRVYQPRLWRVNAQGSAGALHEQVTGRLEGWPGGPGRLHSRFMHDRVSALRAGLAVVALGAAAGALCRTSLEAFGGSIESLMWPLCGWLVARTLANFTPPMHTPTFSSRPLWEWIAAALTISVLFAGEALPALLASGAGLLGLPRGGLSFGWAIVCVAAAFAPARLHLHQRSGSTAVGGALVATGLACALLAPAPIAAVVVAVALLAAPRTAPTETEEAERHPSLEARLVQLGAVVAGTGLWTHLLVAARPSIDPSPALPTAALLGAVLGASLRGGRRLGHPWTGWLAVGALGASFALLLPHMVGAQRLLLHAATTALDPTFTPSLVSIAVGLLGGCLGGAFVGSLPGSASRARELPLAVAVGLMTCVAWPVAPSGWGALGVGATLTAGALLAARRRKHQVGAVALVGLLAVGAWRGPSLPIDLLVLSSVNGLRDPGAWETHLKRAVDNVVGTTTLDSAANGAVVAAPDDWRAPESLRAGQDSPFEVDIAGRISRPTGRAADAEMFAGALAVALAPRHDRVLLLNDDLGHALGGVASIEPATVDVATPLPAVVRDVARLSPARKDRWLAPGVRLWPDHPSVVLRRAPQPAAVVDIHHATWFDSAHAAPTPSHLHRVRDRLGDYGVYVMVLHLEHLAPGVPARIAESVAQAFPHVQVWLPPTGADSLVVTASGRPFSLARLEERFETLKPIFRGLGFPNVASLASMAVGDRDTVDDWQSEPAARLPSSLVLSHAVRGRRHLHMSSLAPHLGTVSRIWDLDGAKTGAAALVGRLDSRKRFLELLGDAARGDMAAALDKARGLADDDDGDRALGALVGPHMAKARDALERASREGPKSSAWSDVHRFATTARMIAPTSAEPLVLLGSMSFAQGNLGLAHDRFAEAARLAEGDLDALTGLARVARLRRDPVAAERYFREAASANPRSWVAWHRLGVFLTEIQRHENAKPLLERAIGLAEGKSSAPNLALGRLYLETDRATPALIQAESALVLDPNAEAFMLRGLAYLALDQLGNAEKDFRQAVLANPSMAAAHGEIGRIRASKGDLAAAEEAWKAVLRIDSDNANARENLRRLGAEERRSSAASEPSTP